MRRADHSIAGKLGLAAAIALVAVGCSPAAPRYVAWPAPTPPAARSTHAAAGRAAPVLPRGDTEPASVRVHAPFRDNQCTSCHLSEKGGGPLLAHAERVCSGCHVDDVQRARFHRPAGRSCLSCHSPHVSMARGRLAGDEARICQRCHELRAPRVAKAHQGHPVERVRCSRCHDPHGWPEQGPALQARTHKPMSLCTNCHVPPGDGPPLALHRAEREACRRCHPEARLLEQGAREHAPVASGCTTCHDPHSSNREHLLTAAEQELCGRCHGREVAWGTGPSGHAPVATGKCHACHSPHASARPHLLVAAAPDLCTSCHRTMHATRGPAAENGGDRCLACHDPHGSGRRGLLRATPAVVARTR